MLDFHTLLRSVAFAATLSFLNGCDRKNEASEKAPIPNQSTESELESNTQNSVPQTGSRLAEISNIVTRAQLPDTAIADLEEEIDANPKAVAKWVGTLPLGSNRDTCLALVFGKWGAIDAPAAIAFARENLSGMDLSVAAASIAPSMAAKSPESANAALALVTEPVPRAGVIRSAIAAAFESNPDQAASWSLAQSSLDDRKAAIIALTDLWSQQDPRACSAWVDSVLKGDEKTVAASVLIAAWGRLSPSDAVQWLETQKADIDYEEVAPVLAENWSLVDPKAAATWATQEMNMEIRSNLMATIVSIWVLNEAANSIEWASGIQDAELRKSILESAFASLAMESPSALADWINKNSGHAAIHDAEEVQAGFE